MKKFLISYGAIRPVENIKVKARECGHLNVLSFDIIGDEPVHFFALSQLEIEADSILILEPRKGWGWSKDFSSNSGANSIHFDEDFSLDYDNYKVVGVTKGDDIVVQAHGDGNGLSIFGRYSEGVLERFLNETPSFEPVTPCYRCVHEAFYDQKFQEFVASHGNLRVLTVPLAKAYEKGEIFGHTEYKEITDHFLTDHWHLVVAYGHFKSWYEACPIEQIYNHRISDSWVFELKRRKDDRTLIFYIYPLKEKITVSSPDHDDLELKLEPYWWHIAWHPVPRNGGD